jgi:hypothetical protein
MHHAPFVSPLFVVALAAAVATNANQKNPKAKKQ